jgi:nitrate reductase cytochrome c-type subunit
MKNLIKVTSIFILLLTIGCDNPKKEVQKVKEIPTEIKPISALEQGQKYALKTKSALGKNLMGTIKSKGTIGALSFCNENAISLTNSTGIENNIQIKRVSDKNRNPENKANVNELSYIEKTKDQLMYGKKITPQIQEIDSKMVGYYPIVTNKMCLQCHGNSTSDIKPNTYSKIKELYPNDIAVGYSENELRGIWVVTMPKE